jgi:hypothetical protein
VVFRFSLQQSLVFYPCYLLMLTIKLSTEDGFRFECNSNADRIYEVSKMASQPYTSIFNISAIKYYNTV